ncbi:MAG: hypothetical protein LBJ67_08285 [Planctomycetaceae bacterium]|nr:hypothetical protein [Planctomycetaceae bacterium]
MKEETRRLVAAVYHPEITTENFIGIENHLNVFYGKENGILTPQIAQGLAMYLNSTLVDLYFRQFSGHTQVNAMDLKRLPYPDMKTLYDLGKKCMNQFPDQNEIDKMIEQVIE